MPAKSPPSGLVVCLPARAPKLKGVIKPARLVRWSYATGDPTPARDRNLARRYGVGVPAGLEIAPVSEEQFEQLLPMIASYQGFYEADDVRTERNREFFRRFLAPSDCGEMIAAWDDGRLVGYACMYWHFSSTRAVETVLMNDLYVDEAERGQGIGRALIEACAAVARRRGAHHLEWSTAPDNKAAQRLYDSTGATRSTWLEYELGL